MAAMDPNRRKFLKHLSLLGVGALIGLGITHATSPSETQLINDYSNAEIKSGRKLVWKDLTEFSDYEVPLKIHEVREGGKPRVRVSVCAYHIDNNGDGIYEKSEEGNYCRMPCKAVCPVDAITIKEHTDPEKSYEGKKAPEIVQENCIGCTKCFRICGFNAIEWINENNLIK